MRLVWHTILECSGNRGFLTSIGQPIKNGKQVAALLEIIPLPHTQTHKKLAVIRYMDTPGQTPLKLKEITWLFKLQKAA